MNNNFKPLRKTNMKSFFSYTLLIYFIFLLSHTTYPQPEKPLLDYKTIEGTMVNLANVPWDGQIAELYFDGSLLSSDTLRNGLFRFENIFVSVEDAETEVNTTALLPFSGNNIIWQQKSAGRTDITIYDITGSAVRKYSKTVSAGKHELYWDGKNNLGNSIASGVYLLQLSTPDAVINNKLAVNNSSIIASGKTVKVETGVSLKKMLSGYMLKVYGEDVLTKEWHDVDLSGNSPINLGTLVAPGKPIITGFLYDLETKYDSLGNRQHPVGIPGLKVVLGSDTTRQTYTDAQGRFMLKAEKTGMDSVYVFSLDSEFYHVKRGATFLNHNGNPRKDTLVLNPEMNVLRAKNDTTAGIPMFRQFVDQNGEDLLDFLVYITRARERDGSTRRVRDEDLPIKTYLNRPVAPTPWYPDSAWSGLQAIAGGRFQFVEVHNINDALLKVSYTHNSAGQGTDLGFSVDAMGGYLSNWRINIRGPNPLQPEIAPYIVAHEIAHFIFTSGVHSPHMSDMIYLGPLERQFFGWPMALSPKEERARDFIYTAERNPLIVSYFKNGDYGVYVSPPNAEVHGLNCICK